MSLVTGWMMERSTRRWVKSDLAGGAGPCQLYFVLEAIGSVVAFRDKQDRPGSRKILARNDKQGRLLFNIKVLGKKFVRHTDIDCLVRTQGTRPPRFS